MKLFHRTYQGPADKTPLVILHGLFGASDNWHNIAQKLCEDRVVVTADLRNHGASPHSEEMNYSAMAEDVRELIEDVFHSHSVHVLGHSMGGKVAMTLASQHPHLLESLIVADIAPKAYPPGHTDIIQAMESLELNSYSRRSEAENALKKYIANPSIALFILKNIERRKEGGYQWKINLPVLVESYPFIIGAVHQDWPFTAPTLFMKGEQSAYISGQDEIDIPDEYVHAEFVTISNAGHWLHADNPEEFVQKLTEFLQEVSKR